MNTPEHDHTPPDTRPPVIVTGSSGLIGCAIIESLREEFQVIGFDRAGEPTPPPEIECICVDLTDDDSVRSGLERVRHAYGPRVASVVHLAAYYDFSGEPSELYDEVTVKGTKRLLEQLQRQEFEVERLLFSSTMLVHRPTRPGVPITESSPLEARWDYPQSKIETEQLIRADRDGIPALLLRIAGVYTDTCDSIPLAHQIQRIAEHRVTGHVFPGDTSHGQAFVHLDDLVAAAVLAVKRRGELGPEETLLIGEPETPGYDDLQRAIARLLHGDEDWSTQEIAKSVAKTGAWVKNKVPGVEEPFIKPWMVDMADDHYELDVTAARQRLGWKPRRRLLDVLPTMIERLKADPAGWYEHHGLEGPPPDLPGAAPSEKPARIEA